MPRHDPSTASAVTFPAVTNVIYTTWTFCATCSHVNSKKTKPCLKKCTLRINSVIVNGIKISVTDTESHGSYECTTVVCKYILSIILLQFTSCFSLLACLVQGAHKTNVQAKLRHRLNFSNLTNTVRFGCPPVVTVLTRFWENSNPENSF